MQDWVFPTENSHLIPLFLMKRVMFCWFSWLGSVLQTCWTHLNAEDCLRWGQDLRQGQRVVSILTKKISLKPLLLWGKQIWISHSVSCFKHAACDLLAGTMEAERWGTWSVYWLFSPPLSSFILMHLISPPSSFVEHLSFTISPHQSLYPCWVRNCVHYLWHVQHKKMALCPRTNVSFYNLELLTRLRDKDRAAITTGRLAGKKG